MKFDENQLILCSTIKYFISIERLGIITPACYLVITLYEECPTFKNELNGYYFKIYLFLGFSDLEAEFPERLLIAKSLPFLCQPSFSNWTERLLETEVVTRILKSLRGRSKMMNM